MPATTMKMLRRLILILQTWFYGESPGLILRRLEIAENALNRQVNNLGAGFSTGLDPIKLLEYSATLSEYSIFRGMKSYRFPHVI